jgi:hypothetical protein
LAGKPAIEGRISGSATDSEKIPGVLGMQSGLNGVSMPVGAMEKALYSSYTQWSTFWGSLRSDQPLFMTSDFREWWPLQRSRFNSDFVAAFEAVYELAPYGNLLCPQRVTGPFR